MSGKGHGGKVTGTRAVSGGMGNCPRVKNRLSHGRFVNVKSLQRHPNGEFNPPKNHPKQHQPDPPQGAGEVPDGTVSMGHHKEEKQLRETWPTSLRGTSDSSINRIVTFTIPPPITSKTCRASSKGGGGSDGAFQERSRRTFSPPTLRIVWGYLWLCF